MFLIMHPAIVLVTYHSAEHIFGFSIKWIPYDVHNQNKYMFFYLYKHLNTDIK